MSKVVLVIKDGETLTTLTQPDPTENEFKEETEKAAADQGAAADQEAAADQGTVVDHDFRLEIRGENIVFIKDKKIHSVVCSLRDMVPQKPAGQTAHSIIHQVNR